ncbi:MAG TPA: T9SS type B sorting domain-containing protein [Flavobacteriales bacterium]|nr:T9SS type B sorting domain-containing protein [Flavobacteriales bacterium]
MQITGSFIAVGGEEYVTIGVFAPESNLTINSTGGPSLSSFYLVDDVCITLIPHDSTSATLVADTSVCTGSPITIKAPPGYASYEWQDTLGATLSSTDSLSILPAASEQVILYALDESACPHMMRIDTVNLTNLCGALTVSGNVSICSGDSTLLLASNSSTGYNWADSTNMGLVLSTDSFYMAQPSVTTTYAVRDSLDTLYTTVQVLTCLSCADNIVPNAGFEDTVFCPSANDEINAVPPWDNPPANPGQSTADYYNTCGFTLGIDMPNSGDGFTGIILYSGANVYREYLQVPLDSVLKAGTCYQVSMYTAVSTGIISSYYVDSIGMYFSNGASMQGGGGTELITATPQITNDPGVDMTSSNWQFISGTFVASGGEDYLSIGNFASDANSNPAFFGGFPTLFAYYLVDDVCVVEIPNDSITSVLLADTSSCGGTLTLNAPAGYASYEWQDTLGTVLSTADSLTLIPSGFEQVILYATDASSCPATVNIDTIDITLGAGATPIIFTPNSWYCATDNITDLTSDIGDVWFSDASLTTQVGVDSFFTPPVIIGTSTYYVIDTTGGCYSLADSVTVTFDTCSYPCPLIQNQLTNGDFETFSACPTGPSELPNATGWIDVQSNSNDYFNCSYFGTTNPGFNSTTTGMFLPPSGTGYTGIFLNGTGLIGREGFGQQVTLKKCIEYTIQLRVAHNLDDGPPDNDLCIYGGNTAMTAPCMSTYDQLTCISKDSISLNWSVFTLTFIPAQNYSYIAFGGACPTVGTASIGGYVYIDEVFLCESPCLATYIDSVTIVPIADDTCGLGTGSMTVDFNTYCYTGFDFEWKQGSVVVSTDSIATGLSAGSYTLSISDSNCSMSMVGPSISPFSPSIPIVINPSSGSICSGDSIPLSASGATSYVWSPSTGLSCTSCPNPVATPTSTTTYQVVGSTGSCSDSSTITITVSSSINTLDTAIICAGDSLFLGGAWQSTSGSYKDTLTSSGGCDSIVTTTLSVDSLLDATITGDSSMCENSVFVTLSAATPGGIWSGVGIDSLTGAFDPSVAGAGTHEIFYTLNASCGNSDTIDITVYALPMLSFVTTDESCEGENDGAVDLTVAGGATPYTYLWDDPGSSNSEDLILMAPGTYTVVITDGNLCAASGSASIFSSSVPCSTPYLYIPNIFSPNGDGENERLFVQGSGIKELTFIIYDRWGEKIFESEDTGIGWDGTYKGKPMNEAVFVYYVKATFINSEIVEKKGNITLVR